MAQTHIHIGPHTDIPTTASPGLLFLRAFLPAVDHLSPSTSGSPPLLPFLHPSARFIINNGPPTPADPVLSMMSERRARLSISRHELRAAWDIEAADASGRRTVLYETVSVTVFKGDTEERALEVGEFSVLELVLFEGEAKEEEGMENDVRRGVEGLVAVVSKTFMDANPIMQRWKQVMGAV